MAATVLVQSAHGAGPTLTDITLANERHSTDDVYAASGTSNPIPIPASGSAYSFWRSRRLNATVTPSTAINNLKWFSDGASSSPSGVTWLAQAANVGAAAGYRVATGVVGSSGDVLNTTNHTGLTGAPVDPFTFTAASPKSLAGSISNPATGAFGDYFVMQLVVASTVATTGAITAETYTVQWDET